MGRLRRHGLFRWAAIVALISMGIIAGPGGVQAADKGMNIATGNPQIVNAETAGVDGEQVVKDDPSHDAGVVFGKESRERKVQVNLGDGVKAFFSVGSSPLDFDGHRVQNNYGATFGLNIPL